jgi:hypothetical protein
MYRQLFRHPVPNSASLPDILSLLVLCRRIANVALKYGAASFQILTCLLEITRAFCKVRGLTLSLRVGTL